MIVRNIDRYLNAVVAEFCESCDTGFSDEFEAKKALWKAAVVVWETAEEPELWLDQLRDYALDVIDKPSKIESTIRSAERRANSHG